MQRHFCLLWPCLVVRISLAVPVHKQGLIDSGKFCFDPRVMKHAHTRQFDYIIWSDDLRADLEIRPTCRLLQLIT